MKRVLTNLALCSVVLSGLAVTAHAAEDIRSAGTKSDIQFFPGGDDVVPTPDPNPDTDPEKDPDPDPIIVAPGEAEQGQMGPLRFTYLPDISFGKTQLIAQKQNYYADYMKRTFTKDGVEQIGEYPTFLTLEDLRGDTKGWSVSIKHSGKFKNAENEEINATIWFKNPYILSGSFEGDTSQTPETLTGATGERDYFNISTGSDVLLASAAKGKGYGKWSVGYGTTNEEDKTTGYGLDGNKPIPAGVTEPHINQGKKGKNKAVKLEVPAQVISTDETKSKYTSVLEWTISNVPF
ncbi:WxL domain-containing protein [Vagococcus sp.]|uniref:WxL domain-containing protein n=1 Tax=Vagococcus sp. TaxID=1933889 RepID=UPI003F975048